MLSVADRQIGLQTNGIMHHQQGNGCPPFNVPPGSVQDMQALKTPLEGYHHGLGKKLEIGGGGAQLDQSADIEIDACEIPKAGWNGRKVEIHVVHEPHRLPGLIQGDVVEIGEINLIRTGLRGPWRDGQQWLSLAPR
jgi:hypothetical protein